MSTIRSLAFLSLAILLGCSACAGSRQRGANDILTRYDRTGAERGPATLEIDADPNGLWWDDDSATLYVADEGGNRILSWTEAQGFAPVMSLPSAKDQRGGLGQLLRLKDGTLVVTRFGHGSSGDVLMIDIAGSVRSIPGLDPTRRRIGLTLSREGLLFDAWFVHAAEGGHSGGVSRVAPSGGETDLIRGLAKPVGVLAMGADLFVSDQDRGQILKSSLSNPGQSSVFATLEKPDLLAAGPAGSLFTAGGSGNLYHIDHTGHASVLATGFKQVRGVAYDPTNRRLFVADHDPDEQPGVQHALRIIPVD